jgi:hypothetical protein
MGSESEVVMVLHNHVSLQSFVSALYSELCLTSFQDGGEVMDIKPEVTEVKEKEEDPLAVTLESEQEVSFVSAWPL